MRILWIAPWFRGLAHIYGRGLSAQGHDVRVVTSCKHPAPGPPLVEELICPSKPYDPGWPRSLSEAGRFYRTFQPDVVITDQFTDPVFAFLARRMQPSCLVIHDAVPHDHTHQVHGIRRLAQRAGDRANHIITFSSAVTAEVEATRRPSDGHIHQIKLLGEVREEDVPAVRPAEERRDFVLMGRIRPYKNLEHVLQAWTSHVRGRHYQGDRLIIWGTSDWRDTQNRRSQINTVDGVEWRSEVYRYSDIHKGRFSGFKGSLCVYSEASQSGIQLLCSQLGVTPIVSDVGGLPEYQAPGLPVIDPTDQAALVDVLDYAADPEVATKLGGIAQEFYASTNSESAVTKTLATALERTIGI